MKSRPVCVYSPIRRSLLRGIGVALLLACSAVVLAQGQNNDDVLQHYKLAVGSLNDSISALATDSAHSLQDLQRAENALRPLAQQTTSSSLISDMGKTFERARTAVTNRSQTDLSVQATVLKGGFERLLYESALRELQAGHADIAQQRLETLFETMGLSLTSRQALTQSKGDLAKTQAAFELGAAGSILTDLSRAEARAQTSVDSGYEALSAAYAHFITIQDSPHVSATATSTFVNATNALLAKDKATFKTQLATLRQQLNTLVQGARNTLSQPAGARAAPAATSSSPQHPASGGVSVALPNTVASNPAPAAPGGQSGNATSPAPSPATTSTAASPAPTAAVSSILKGLAGASLSPSAQSALAQRYLASGLTSIDSAWDRLYADTAQAAAALQAGDQEQAKQRLEAFQSTYQSYLEPLITSNAALDQSTLSLLDTLRNAPSLRVQDIAALAAQVDTLRNARQGLPQRGLQQTVVGVSHFWVGLLRLVVMIVLAILAFIPLRLLNLAFGNNRNWQFISLALFLLLLPLIYEGLCALGALIAKLTGVSGLNTLATYSIFQNNLSQLIWAALMAAAIGFAWIGLHGICVQFGLLGKQRTGAELPEAQVRKTSAKQEPEAVVDWDEEF